MIALLSTPMSIFYHCGCMFCFLVHGCVFQQINQCQMLLFFVLIILVSELIAKIDFALNSAWVSRHFVHCTLTKWQILHWTSTKCPIYDKFSFVTEIATVHNRFIVNTAFIYSNIFIKDIMSNRSGKFLKKILQKSSLFLHIICIQLN